MKQDSIAIMVYMGALKRPRGLTHPLRGIDQKAVLVKHLCSHTFAKDDVHEKAL